MAKKYIPVKTCQICDRRLQWKTTYEMGVCSKCVASRDEFKELRNERQKKYWKDNPSKYLQMLEKRLERYAKEGV